MLDYHNFWNWKIVFQLILYHWTIFYVTETPFKMASTLSQNKEKFKIYIPYDFVHISRACGPNTFQIMYGQTLDFQCHKMSDQKINVCSKFAIKTCPRYHCKCWHWKSKVSAYIIYTYLYHVLVKLLYNPKYTKFWAFDNNNEKKCIEAILQKVSAGETIV